MPYIGEFLDFPAFYTEHALHGAASDMSPAVAKCTYQLLVHDLGKPCTTEDLQKHKNYTWLLDVLRCPKEAGCKSILWSVQQDRPTLLVWMIGKHTRCLPERTRLLMLLYFLEWETDCSSFMKAMRKTALDLLRHTRQTAMPDMKVLSDHAYTVEGYTSEDMNSTSKLLQIIQYKLEKDFTFENHLERLEPAISMEGRSFTMGQSLPQELANAQKKEGGDSYVLILVAGTSLDSAGNAGTEKEAVNEAIDLAGGRDLSQFLLNT